MPSAASRRQLLRSTGAALVAGLAGCAAGDGSALATDDLAFLVQPVEVFTDDHPARLRITLGNASDAPLTVVGSPQPVVDPTADGGLHLVPDDTRTLVAVDGQGDPLDVPLVPAAPTDGCWTAGYADVRVRAVEARATLEPDQALVADYSLVDAAGGGCLPTRDVAFGDTRTVERDGSRHGVRLSFVVTIDAGSLSVAVDDPVVSSPGAG